MRVLPTLLCLLLALPALATEIPPHGVVLLYHRFDEDRYPTTNIRMRQFEAQLDYLQQNGFTIWPLRRLLDAVLNQRTVPDKTIALTVDDAFLSVYQHAFPLIKKRHVPLTVFVSSGPVDNRMGGYMSWKQMREMQRHGVDFANHSTSHGHLQERREGEDESAWETRVAADITHAQQRIDAELGDQGTKLFAYPYGEFNCSLGKLVRKLGYTGISQSSGALGPLSRREAIPRFPINEHFSPLDTFSLKVASLPMPVVKQSPKEPTLQGENPPVLNLEFTSDSGTLGNRLKCYLGNGTPINVTALDDGHITVQASKPLRKGRSHYNCTVSTASGRYYWFSQPWQNGPDAADPDR